MKPHKPADPQQTIHDLTAELSDVKRREQTLVITVARLRDTCERLRNQKLDDAITQLERRFLQMCLAYFSQPDPRFNPAELEKTALDAIAERDRACLFRTWHGGGVVGATSNDEVKP